MVGTNLDYLARRRRPAIIIEVFPRNESDETRFSKFHSKRIQQNSEAVCHPWLILLALEKRNLLLLLQIFSRGYALAQHSMLLLSTATTLVPPFSSGRYLAREVLLMVVNFGLIRFYGAVY